MGKKCGKETKFSVYRTREPPGSVPRRHQTAKTRYACMPAFFTLISAAFCPRSARLSTYKVTRHLQITEKSSLGAKCSPGFSRRRRGVFVSSTESLFSVSVCGRLVCVKASVFSGLCLCQPVSAHVRVCAYVR